VAWEPLLWVLTFLGVLAAAASTAAILMALRFSRRVFASRIWDHAAFLPRVLMIVPCRGADPGLDRNLDAILTQAYPDYRVVFSVDGFDDPALPAIEAAWGRHRVPTGIALPADLPDVGGKGRALLGGLAKRDAADEVVVFLDSDIRPGPRFLRDLVQPLALPLIGATTGYRWYVPVRGGLWSVVRSAWNAAGLNIFFSDRYNFLWGGAWAIRAEILDRLDLPALWRGTLSEDLAATRGVKALGLRVQFVPQAVAATFEDCDRADCIRWTDRQTAMVALWGRHIRNFAAATYGVFTGSALLGLASLVLAGLADIWFLLPAALFLWDVPVAVANGWVRKRAVFRASPSLVAGWRVSEGAWAGAGLVVPWLILGNLIRTRRVRTIEWRGKRYDVSAGHLRGA